MGWKKEPYRNRLPCFDCPYGTLRDCKVGSSCKHNKDRLKELKRRGE